MPFAFDTVPLEPFTSTWVPSWGGFSKVFTLTDLKEDPSQFVAYGTDGLRGFRVQGGKASDLTPFLDLMSRQGAEYMQAPPDYIPAPDSVPEGGSSTSGLGTYDVIIKPPTIPSANSVQLAFEAELGEGSIAA